LLQVDEINNVTSTTGQGRNQHLSNKAISMANEESKEPMNLDSSHKRRNSMFAQAIKDVNKQRKTVLALAEIFS
jgi:hypothetical protein